LNIPETVSENKEEYLQFADSPKSFIEDNGHTFDYASFLSFDNRGEKGSKSENPAESNQLD